MPVQADDRETLRDLPAARDAGGIILPPCTKSPEEGKTPIQFSMDALNMIVISDEAHRSR